MARDIAIVGLACRFPGDADSEHSFWDLLCKGETTVSENSERWNADGFHHPKRLNASITRRAHYLKQDISSWDANFFNTSAAEADAIDPQQRMLMEVAYEALENAGIPAEAIAGSRTGVFIGSFTSDYRELIHRDSEHAPSYALTGSSNCSTSNRISWFFDLKGPSLTLNTACSSSLVALHLACQSLLTGDSDFAIVGGTNLLLNPDIFMYLSNQGFLAPDGRCKSFDASGNGYGRGEGSAAIILRRADDAIASHDPIRAVIRGTGSNQDGKTKGFTLPSADAQARLTEETYKAAGLDYADTHYVEAHGTGTQAGDFEETKGLARTIAAGRSPLQPLLIGSVKSNIGHLEGCAGLAGLIKAVLVLEHGVIPPTYGIETLNPKVSWDDWHLEVPTEITPWPTEGIRRISTQGFGYGGSNAHAIIDDAASYLSSRGISTYSAAARDAEVVRVSEAAAPKIFMLSAQDREGLSRTRKALSSHLTGLDIVPGTGEREYLQNLAFTLANRRSRLRWSTFVVASTLQELHQELGTTSPHLGSRTRSDPPRLTFVFTGQGAQWPRMGHDLMIFPAYRDSVLAAGNYLQTVEHCAWSVEEALAHAEAESRIHEAEYSQSLCTILQIALVDLLTSWDVRPDALIGHSSGEIAAAYCAGALSREDAWKIAYLRGVCCAQLRESQYGLYGSMIAANTSLDVARDCVAKVSEGVVTVACLNSRSSVTLAGDETAIDQLSAILKEMGIASQKLRVDCAYHSQHMQAIAHDYLEALSGIQPTQIRKGCSLFSGVLGGPVTNPFLGPAFWVKNLIAPVRFSEAMSNLLTPATDSASESSVIQNVFLEIGPHDALRGPVLDTIEAHGMMEDTTYLATISRNSGGPMHLMSSIAHLATLGGSPNLDKVNSLTPRNCLSLNSLPAYPWNRSLNFWHETRISMEYRTRARQQTRLLGAPHPKLADGESIWRGFIRTNEEHWISQHVIQGDILYPAAGFISMAIEAMCQQASNHKTISSFQLRDVIISAALVISKGGEAECVVQLRPRLAGTRSDTYDWMEFVISTSVDRQELRKNCYGLIKIEYMPSPDSGMAAETELEFTSAKQDWLNADRDCANTIQTEKFYNRLATNGLKYGPDFARLKNIRYGLKQSCSTLSVAFPASSMAEQNKSRPHIIHPTTLDAMFHTAFAAMLDRGTLAKGAMVPTLIEHIYVSAAIPFEESSMLQAHASTMEHGFREVRSDITVLDSDLTSPCVRIRSLNLTSVSTGSFATTPQIEHAKLCYEVCWRPVLSMISRPELERYLSERLNVHTDGSGERKRMAAEVCMDFIELVQHGSIVAVAGLRLFESQISADRDTEGLILTRSARFENIMDTIDYSVVVSDEAYLKALPEKDRAGVNSFVGDLTSGPVSASVEGRAIDLILLDCGQNPSMTTLETALQNSAASLSPDGHIILLQPKSADMAAALKKHGLEANAVVSGNPGMDDIVVILSPRKADKEIQTVRKAVLLLPTAPDSETSLVASQIENSFSRCGIDVQKTTWGAPRASVEGRICVSLVELSHSLLSNIAESDFDYLKLLILEGVDLIWVTKDSPAGALMSGLMRSVRNESTAVRCRTLRLDAGSLSSAGASVVAVATGLSQDEEFRCLDGVVCSSRIDQSNRLTHQVSSTYTADSDHLLSSSLGELQQPVKMSIKTPGILETICMVPDVIPQQPLLEGEIEIDVKATGMNFREVMAALGQIPDDRLGFDCAGIIRRVGAGVDQFVVGDRVAMYGHGAHRTVHRALASYCEKIPDGFSFEEAATISLVHGTAWYGLVKLARAEPGQSILIHAASGGVGQAAIMLAQHIGLKIYATVGSQEKESHIFSTYGLSRSHIFSSRDTSFSKAIMRATNGRGVDIILNSLSGEALRESWNCLAPFGIFLEIGLKDILNNSCLDMSPFRKDATFVFYNLNHIEQARPKLMGEIIQAVFGLLRQKAIRPVSPLRVFDVAEAESAFRLMQRGKHYGKIALRWSPSDQVQTMGINPCKFRLDPEGVYLLVGGLGGIGRSLALLLVDLGARKLCFLSRSGPKSTEARDLLNNLHSRNVQTVAYACDVGDSVAVRNSLDKCVSKLGRVRGVIQGAMNLQDVLFENMTSRQWNDALRPKVQGTAHVHEVLGNDLDFFLVLSSFAGVFGNRGQANYAAAGAFQDSFAQSTRGDGLKIVTIDLGIIRDVGVLAETGGTDNLRQWEDAFGIRENELHRLIQMSIEGLQGEILLPPQLSTGFATAQDFARFKLDVPYYFKDARFSILAARGGTEIDANGGPARDQQNMSCLDGITKAASLNEAAGHVSNAIVARLAKTLQTDVSEIDLARPIHTYGVDSLVAVELSQWLHKECQATISVFDLLSSVPISSLSHKIATKSTALPASLRAH